MKRPYIICHILSSLDGKIAGPFMGTTTNIKMSKEYGRIRTEMNADAWLYGTTTTKEFVDFKTPHYTDETNDVPLGDYIVDPNANLYYVSVDINGEIGWESGIYRREGRPDAHIIEVLTEATPLRYCSYLRERGISYIIAGKDSLDCQLAVQKLYQLFGIKKLLICGGGIVNWSFLESGVVDELSLLMSPVTDGERNHPIIFENYFQDKESKPISFSLKNVEIIENNGLHITYLVKGEKN